ncbi:YqaJ viral recombinase family protein [Lachnospiraceae bacterium ZAX-1]
MYKELVSTKGLPYADWLEYRRKGLGGSDASVVCGINRYKTPIELYMDKTGQSKDTEPGEAAYWGTQLESLVRTEFTRRTGLEVTIASQILQNEERPFMLANLDGICEHPLYGTCVFEAKTAGAYLAGKWEETIPDEYMLQVQHYLAVTGFKGAYIAVLIGGNTFKWRFIERDEELIEMLVKLEGDFWRHVESSTPPPIDGSDASVKFLNERFPNSIPHTHITLPDTAKGLILSYDSSCEIIRNQTEKKQEAENLIKQMLGDNEAGIISDRVVAWKTVAQERLDSKTLKAEHPQLCKKYTATSLYRRFSIKDIKKEGETA